MKKVYLLGDSLMLSFSNPSQTLENELADLLGGYWEVTNKGAGGDTTEEMLDRLQDDVLDDSPDYVVVWGGINDVYGSVSAATIQDNLQDIYTDCHNAGIKVIAVNLHPSKGDTNWDSTKQAVVDAVNTWIAGTATDIDDNLDIYSVLEDPSNDDKLLPAYNGGDWMHLSVAGYEKVADEIFNVSDWSIDLPTTPGWHDFTPVLYATTNPDAPSKISGRYHVDANGLVVYTFHFKLSAGVGAGAYRPELPLLADNSDVANMMRYYGSGIMKDASAGAEKLMTLRSIPDQGSNKLFNMVDVNGNVVGNTSPFTFAVNDELSGQIIYKKA